MSSRTAAFIAIALSMGSNSLPNTVLAKETVSAKIAGAPAPVAYRQLSPMRDESVVENKLDQLATDALNASAAGQTDLAEKLFHKILEISPSSSSAKYNLGVLAEKRGQKVQALSWYKQALAQKPEDNGLKKAVTELSSEINRTNAMSQDAYVRRLSQAARSAFAKGNFPLAINCLEKLSKMYPQDERIHFALGQSYTGIGDLKRAEQHLRVANALAQGDTRVAETYQQFKRLKRQAEIASYQKETLNYQSIVHKIE